MTILPLPKFLYGRASFLWNVKQKAGGLFGQCIKQANILHPQANAFAYSCTGHGFLRQLHGVQNRDNVVGTWLSDGGAVMARLRNYACVAGNDYTKFEDVGPMRDMDIAIPEGTTRDTVGLAQALVESTASLELGVVLRQLETSIDMFRHPIVWDPRTGKHRHLSGVESSDDVTVNTGAYGYGFFMHSVPVLANRHLILCPIGCVLRYVQMLTPPGSTLYLNRHASPLAQSGHIRLR